jgi:hypothetical protein
MSTSVHEKPTELVRSANGLRALVTAGYGSLVRNSTSSRPFDSSLCNAGWPRSELPPRK